jgi:4-amino-4-deoxy-L-arabinose transferase-like glycosyltransferase
MGASPMRPAWLILAFVLLLRLPFLNQAIQGDDIYYLAGAQHAQVDPLHPNHARYVFVGDVVDMRGHPHPPFNAWWLGALLFLTGNIREIPFHAAYILFSLLVALSMWTLAKRFTPRPLEATLLFLATPAFVVNGTSIESDLPLLAFWMATAALFVAGVDKHCGLRLSGAAGAGVLAAMTGYQAAALVPILGFYLWRKARGFAYGWAALLALPVAILLWQAYERLATGATPVEVLGSYFQTYGLQRLTNKLRNAAALLGHAGWLVCPVLVWLAAPRRYWLAAVAAAPLALADPHPLFWLSAGTGLMLLVWSARSDEQFLGAWVAVFFTASVALFFAGSARYLLPMAAPAVLLVSRSLARRDLLAGFGIQAALSLSLAWVNYQHWDGYRQFASEFRKETLEKRVWINGEWGLRHYFEENGGLALVRGQAVQPGEMVVSSELGFPIPFNTGGGVTAPIREAEIRPTAPLRMIGLGVRSAWSTATLGLRPFDIGNGPVDRVRMEGILEAKPVRELLRMGDPAASTQIVSGVYELEGGAWRWMADKAVLLLKTPNEPKRVVAKLYLPEQAPGRTVILFLEGKQIAGATYSRPGSYTLESAPLKPVGESVSLTIRVDRTFSPPGDHRRLGLILSEVGFAASEQSLSAPR